MLDGVSRSTRISRRGVILAASAAVGPRIATRPVRAQASEPLFSYPMGAPGQALGDGLYTRIAYAAENARFYPGWWHTGENWHRDDEQSAGLPVYAAGAGEVVFAGYDYPGLVVIVQHEPALFSMYGHLDDAVVVAPGQRVARGDLLGHVLAREDDLLRSHLHFEFRTFLTTPEINGESPQYGVNCGYNCPPGPGYWPMSAPKHPSQMGWRNPTHVINQRAWPDGVPAGVTVVVSAAARASSPLWTVPDDRPEAERIGDLALTSGERYPLLAIETGAEDDTATSAEATRLWFQIALADGTAGWVQAAVPVAVDSGADGRPASLRFDFLPLVQATVA